MKFIGYLNDYGIYTTNFKGDYIYIWKKENPTTTRLIKMELFDTILKGTLKWDAKIDASMMVDYYYEDKFRITEWRYEFDYIRRNGKRLYIFQV